MKRLIGKSVLRRYLVSFVSIAMFSCAVVGMITYLAAVQELRTSAREEQQKRLMLAVEDMDGQFEQLQDIANRIQTSIYYAPMYISRNAYYEVELLADLEKYGNYSSLLTHYFIRYEGQDAIFSDMGKSYLDVYAQARLGFHDIAGLTEYLDRCVQPGFYPMGNNALAVFPIKMNAAQGYSGRAVVCFFITDTALANRLQLVSGEKFERVLLACGESRLVARGSIADPLTVSGERFSLTVDKAEIGSEIGERFTLTNILLIGVLIILFCALAAAAAVRSYRPIGSIAKRHNLAVGESNELELIDQELVTVKGQLRLSQDQLDARLDQLRDLRGDLQKHFILQLLQGTADESGFARMREAGMYFPGRSFHVFVIRYQGEADVVRAVSELSDESAAYYAAPFGGDNSYAVLVNANECDTAGDMLRDSCSGSQVFGGRSTMELSEIPALLFDALTDTAPSCIRPSDIARCREDERLRRLRKALEKGDDAAAISSLNEYLDAYAGGDQSIRQMIYNNVTSVLLAASYEVNLSIPRDFLRGGYESRPLLDGWVTSLCSARETPNSPEEHQIIRYLREHAFDYDLTLESVAEHFKRSARQIARIVQAETGGGYKEFILRIRMERAKQLLSGGASVAETCEAVCYVSRSHFIKTFTDYTGLTPSRFREQVRASSGANDTGERE